MLSDEGLVLQIQSTQLTNNLLLMVLCITIVGLQYKWICATKTQVNREKVCVGIPGLDIQVRAEEGSLRWRTGDGLGRVGGPTCPERFSPQDSSLVEGRSLPCWGPSVLKVDGLFHAKTGLMYSI